jgi:hypothetical protein
MVVAGGLVAIDGVIRKMKFEDGLFFCCDEEEKDWRLHAGLGTVVI